MVRHVICAAVVALLGGSVVVLAADDKKNQKPLDAGTFVAKAASAGMFEVRSSQLAQERSQKAEVKRFAEQMIADHTKASDELKALAQRKGYSLPTQMDAKCQESLEKLTGARGEAFDTTYIQEQLKAHREAVQLFQQASRTLDDPDLKAWAMKTLPTLQKHLQHVQTLAGGTPNPPPK